MTAYIELLKSVNLDADLKPHVKKHTNIIYQKWQNLMGD